MDFPRWLYDQMEENGVTNNKLSKVTGVSLATVCNWKNGSYFPASKQIMSLARYFQVDPTEIAAMAPEDCVESRLSGVGKIINREKKERPMFSTDELSNLLKLLNDSCTRLKESADLVSSLSVALDEAIRWSLPNKQDG